MKLTTNELRKMIVEELNNIIGEDAADDMMQKMKTSRYSRESGAGASAARFATLQDQEKSIEQIIGFEGLQLVIQIKRLNFDIAEIMTSVSPDDYTMYGPDAIDPAKAERKKRSDLFAQLEEMKKGLSKEQRTQLDASIAQFMRT